MNQEALDSLFKRTWMIMLLDACWGLLLGRSEECDAALEDKFRTNKADAIVEREEFVVVPHAVGLEGFLPCFGTREGVATLLLLVPEGVSEECSESSVANELNFFLI